MARFKKGDKVRFIEDYPFFSQLKALKGHISTITNTQHIVQDYYQVDGINWWFEARYIELVEKSKEYIEFKIGDKVLVTAKDSTNSILLNDKIGTIIAIDKDGGWLNLDIEPGYPKSGLWFRECTLLGSEFKENKLKVLMETADEFNKQYPEDFKQFLTHYKE